MFYKVKGVLNSTLCLLFGLLLASATVRPVFALDLLAGLGSNNFTVSEATAPYAQTATNLTLNASFSLGQFVIGQFTSPYDWSAINSFGLVMSAPVASPNAPFTVEFLDPSTNVISEFQGYTVGLGTSPSFVSLSPSLPGTEDFSAVSGWYFSWGDAGSSAVQVTGIVPEPSTWALLGLGSLLVGFLLFRRRVKVGNLCDCRETRHLPE